MCISGGESGFGDSNRCKGPGAGAGLARSGKSRESRWLS